MVKTINETAVGVVFYYLENTLPNYLLLQYDIHGQNHWDFVKGRSNNKEEIPQTAEREAKEEVGLENVILIPSFQEVLKYSYNKNNGDLVNKQVIYLISELSKDKTNNIRLSSEHKRFNWGDYNQTLALLSYQGQMEILKKANNFIESN